AAATRASAWAQARHCDALLILPGDLPLLTPDDIRQLARLAEPHLRIVVLAPDIHQQGTNAILLRPPDIIPFQFGPDSMSRHRTLARTAQIPCLLFHSSTLAQDIDWPQDISVLQERAPVFLEKPKPPS
ncbi:MAG TPA: 2-phospho-L-lactate guanylyltransferase, partial [Anaerolineae bacterium]|nr:2-phospho-L-lactate guanylyltransferase [Anaerolineae bacterium]